MYLLKIRGDGGFVLVASYFIRENSLNWDKATAQCSDTGSNPVSPTTILLCGKYKTKDVFIIVKISKAERDKLVSMGVPVGSNGISKTHSHFTSWYLCESRWNMQKLNKIRNAKYKK